MCSSDLTLFSVWRNQRYANESEVGRLPMMIEAQQRKVALYGEDVARIEPQTLQGICLEVGGRRIAGPDAAGEALHGLVKGTRDELRAGGREIEQIVGRFDGFELGRQRRTRPAPLSWRRWSICWDRFRSNMLRAKPNCRSGANGWTTSGSNSNARSSTRPDCWT